MIVRKENKVEIYENKIKYKVYMIFLIIIIVLLLLSKMLFFYMKITKIEIITYIVMLIAMIITIKNIKRKEKKQLEIDKTYLTLFNPKKEEVKIKIEKIDKITIPLITFGDAFAIYIKNEEPIVVLRRNACIKLKEFNNLIEEFKTKK